MCNDANEKAVALHKEAKLVDERNALAICSASTCPDAMRASCQTRLVAVNKALPSIVFAVKDGAGKDLTDVKLTIDGASYTGHVVGTAIELDPGAHDFRFEAPGQDAVSKSFVLVETQKERLETVTIAAAAPPPEPPPVAPPGPFTTSPPAIPSTPEGSSAAGSSSPWKAIGLVTAGVGVVGLGLGTVFGLQASSKKNEADCGANGICPNAMDLATLHDALSAANRSTAFFAAGGILAAGGIMMWALAPSAPVQVAPSVGERTASLVLRGTW
jgi:hypothetical protein